ncbi:hypothetical protein [Acidocella facilis]|uniref:hypothetical protein n=1 Tax=Acidocella facilis TaxID=525 RepID=UPI001F36C7F7|nr:hypothetical protein [Acidocella facilis]
MRLTLLALLAAAFVAFALGLGFAGIAPMAMDGSPFRTLAGSSLLGRGTLMAILFGGSFALLPLGLILAGILGMARNAPPRPPRAKRSLRRAKQAEAEQLQTV